MLKHQLAENNNAKGVDPNANNNNHAQTSVEGLKTKDNDATTTFVSDGDVATVGTGLPKNVPSLLHQSSSTNYDQDIATFLRKPTILASGVLSTTDTTPTSLLAYVLPHDAISGSVLYKDKVRGFVGFRGDMHIRWQVNATRFQQGRYMLTYVPTGGSSPTGTNPSGSAAYASHVNSLVARTQLFRIELDVTCDTEGSMVIPYLSCMNYVPLHALGSNYGALGELNLFPYSPLVAVAGSTTAAYTVWIHFENVELIGPAAPQSGRGKFKNSKGKSPGESEQDSQNLGPISSMLVKVSKASSLLGPVPLLGDYAKAVSWFSDIGASAAAVFGWSTPLNLSAPHTVKRVVNSNFAVVDGADESLPLSMSLRNQVGMLDGFSGTDVDEMDFSFFKTIPAWFSTTSWDVTQASGTTLLSMYVTPTLIQTRTQGTLVIHDLSPCAFLAQHFHYWRGSMVYTLKLVKTEFHSGRIAVAFFPTEYFDGAPPTEGYAETNYVHREVLDIRECNEVTFTIPFISSSSWKPTTANNHTGSIKIYVVDPLVAPNTVSSSISILLEASMGPDAEFAIPRSISYTPVMNATPQSGSGSFSNTKPQTNVCELIDSTLGASKPMSDNNINALYSIGESISSWRTLLKSQNTSPPMSAPSPDSYVQMLPFGWPATYITGTTITHPTHTCDLYGRLSSIYLFSRGGVRVKTLNTVSGVSNMPSISYLDVILTGTSYTGSSYLQHAGTDSGGAKTYALRYSGPQQHHATQHNLSVEVQVPQYHKWHSRVNGEHMINANILYGNSGAKTSLATPIIWNHRFSQTIGIMIPTRSGSDDCNFGTFISIPPMTVLLSSIDTA